MHCRTLMPLKDASQMGLRRLKFFGWYDEDVQQWKKSAVHFASRQNRPVANSHNIDRRRNPALRIARLEAVFSASA
jgi:hypothetical protein